MIGGLNRTQLTVDAGRLEDCTGLAAWSQAIALDLDGVSMSTRRRTRRHTFLLRQDLQFIASRGSIVARRGVRRSILTVGRDMAHGERRKKWRGKCGEDPVPEFSSIDLHNGSLHSPGFRSRSEDFPVLIGLSDDPSQSSSTTACWIGTPLLFSPQNPPHSTMKQTEMKGTGKGHLCQSLRVLFWIRGQRQQTLRFHRTCACGDSTESPASPGGCGR